MISVKSKAEFLKFMSLLIDDFKNNPADWENKTLTEYLEAIQAWTEDMEGYYVNNNLDLPKDISWGAFANILKAAKSYE